jgi:hypothetical protein
VITTTISYTKLTRQANGTWTTNRRGRKRRNPLPETWPNKPKRPGTWSGPEGEADATEEDDLGDYDSEDAEESEAHGAYHDELGAVSSAHLSACL